jgi:hypothetical protein
MAESQLEKLFDRLLPYSDGSGRRRFVAGGILVVGGALLNWDLVRSALGTEVHFIDVIKSPVIAGGMLLLVYAVGTLVELIGDLFLVRAAAGVFWSFGLPRRVATSKTGWRRVAYCALAAVAVPFVMAWNLIRGLLGRTDYRLPLDEALTPSARERVAELPAKVAEGLRDPVGDNAEMALRYIVERFAAERDRKWARIVINRVNEVSAITTALFFFVLMLVITGKIGPWSQDTSSSEYLSVRQKKQLLESRISELGKLNEDASEFLESSLRHFSPGVPKIFYLGGFREDLNEVRQREEKKALESLAGSQPSNTAVSGDKADSKLAELKDQLNSIQSAADDLAKAVKAYEELSSRTAAVKTLITLALAVVFLFLYIGFFTSLRNAIVSVLESLSLQQRVANTPQLTTGAAG